MERMRSIIEQLDAGELSLRGRRNFVMKAANYSATPKTTSISAIVPSSKSSEIGYPTAFSILSRRLLL